MKRIAVLAVLQFLFFNVNVKAEDITEKTAVQSPEEYEEDLHYQISGSDDYHFNQETAVLPECNSEKLIEDVKVNITAYQNQNPAQTIVGKREQALMLKRISSFEEISAENVTSKTDYRLADDLIKLKINENVSSIDIRLCKGPKGTGENNLYVIVYAKDGLINVKIINFAEEAAKVRGLEFAY